jgi:hypothetical protein
MIYMVLISLVASALCLITGIGLTVIGASLIGTCLITLGFSSPVLTYLVANLRVNSRRSLASGLLKQPRQKTEG